MPNHVETAHAHANAAERLLAELANEGRTQLPKKTMLAAQAGAHASLALFYMRVAEAA
jgi:hypothetical protein